MQIEKLKPIQSEIVEEICKAMDGLGADYGLLATVGSWGDTLPEAEVLSQLKEWNSPPNSRLRRQSSQRMSGA
jgi:hypothetical protein